MRQRIISAIRMFIESGGDKFKIIDNLGVTCAMILEALQQEESRNVRQSKRMLEYYRKQKHD